MFFAELSGIHKKTTTNKQVSGLACFNGTSGQNWAKVPKHRIKPDKDEVIEPNVHGQQRCQDR